MDNQNRHIDELRTEPIRSVSREHHQRLQELVGQLIGVKNTKHAIVSVRSLDRSFHWTVSVGISHPDQTPMQAETPFWIASVTKLFIASSILKLHEKGILSIDDLASEHLPDNLAKGVLVHRGTDYSNKICIRHLLSHASGLPDYIIVHRKGERSLFDQVLAEGDFAWTTEDAMSIVRDANSPLFPPQDLNQSKYRVQYSDTNFQLLIAIIKQASGTTLHEAFKELLYKPLYLKHTFHAGTNSLEKAKPVATVWYKEKALDEIPQALQSFNDLYSTAEDLTVFMEGLLQGKIFDNPETLDMMVGKWNRLAFGFSPVGPSWPIEYGLGMMRVNVPRILTPFNPIPELIGHTGACGSWLLYCSKLDVILAGSVSQIGAPDLPFRFLPKFLRELESILHEHRKA